MRNIIAHPIWAVVQSALSAAPADTFVPHASLHLLHSNDTDNQKRLAARARCMWSKFGSLKAQYGVVYNSVLSVELESGTMQTKV